MHEQKLFVSQSN